MNQLKSPSLSSYANLAFVFDFSFNTLALCKITEKCSLQLGVNHSVLDSYTGNHKA